MASSISGTELVVEPGALVLILVLILSDCWPLPSSIFHLITSKKIYFFFLLHGFDEMKWKALVQWDN